MSAVCARNVSSVRTECQQCAHAHSHVTFRGSTLLRQLHTLPFSCVKGRGTAIPLQPWTDPAVSRKLRAPRFQDSRHVKLVRLSGMRIGRFGSHWTDIRGIWGFRRSVDNVQVSLKSDEIKSYCTCTPIYTFDHISLSSSQNAKCLG